MCWVVLGVACLAGLVAMHFMMIDSVRSEMYDNGYESQE